MDDEDLDLSAWAAPPAPSGFADRVIARVHATDAVAVAAHQRRRTRRVFWLAGGLVATLVAAAITFVVALTRSPDPAGKPGDGTMVATRPQQLALPGAIANLDPGADVSWQAIDGAIHVQQRSGAATWRVDKARLFLDVGAAVASIEASNATFRVETRMNLTDARVIGAAALTSAAVAFVTVSVYEGHARLSSAGQTIVVQPGATYTVRPGHPASELRQVDDALDTVMKLDVAGTPPVPAMLSPVDELVVPIGESITIHNAGAPIRIRVDTKCATNPTPFYFANGAVGPGDYTYSFTCDGIDKHGHVRVLRDVTIGGVYSPAEGTSWGETVEVAGGEVAARAQVTIEGVPVATTPKEPWRTVAKPPAGRSFIAVRIDGGVDEINYYIRHRSVRPAKDRAATVASFERLMKIAEPTLTPCVKKWTTSETVSVDIDANGKVTDASTTFSDPTTARCLESALRKLELKLGVALHGTYILNPPCNPDDLLSAGTGAVARGQNAEAVKAYLTAYDCKADRHTLQLTFMAACRANDLHVARKFWKLMDEDMQTHLLQMCLHEHITKDMLDE